MVTLFLVHAKVSSPVLVIHGTEDDVIDFSHGLAIYEKCPRAVEPLWVEVRQIEMGCPFGVFSHLILPRDRCENNILI